MPHRPKRGLGNCLVLANISVFLMKLKLFSLLLVIKVFAKIIPWARGYMLAAYPSFKVFYKSEIIFLFGSSWGDGGFRDSTVWEPLLLPGVPWVPVYPGTRTTQEKTLIPYCFISSQIATAPCCQKLQSKLLLILSVWALIVVSCTGTDFANWTFSKITILGGGFGSYRR